MRLGRLLASLCGMTQLYTGTLHALVADASVHLQVRPFANDPSTTTMRGG